MSNAASWAVSAANKFREVTRTTENPTTAALAEGLTYLAEAVRDLHQEIGHFETKISPPSRCGVRFATSRAGRQLEVQRANHR
jgi:hypothetical protein